MKKKLVVFFAKLFFVSFLISLAVTYIGPLFACSFAATFAACSGGNALVLFLSTWINPFLLFVFFSPAILDYIKLRHERDERESIAKTNEE